MNWLNNSIIFIITNIIIGNIIISIASYYIYETSLKDLTKTSKIHKETLDLIYHTLDEIKLSKFSQENKKKSNDILLELMLKNKLFIMDKNDLESKNKII